MSSPVVSFSIDKYRGFKGMTRFNFKAFISPISDVTKILWQFGDGITSGEQNPSHVYQTTGRYEVTLNVYGNNFETIILRQYISIELFLNESLYLDYAPPPTFAGHINKHPFRINITSSFTGDHYISLGALFSKSYSPEDYPSKWSFLKPTWNFFNKNLEPIKSIKTQDTIIKVNDAGDIDPNGTLVMGVTGFAEFYFTDDSYNVDLALRDDPYTTIIATLQTSAVDITNPINFELNLPTFANSKAAISFPYLILWRNPDYLKITENGIRKHTNPRWTTSQIPLVVNTSNTELNFPDDITDGNVIRPIDPSSYFVHSFPLSGQQDIPLSIGLDAVSATFTPTPKFQWMNLQGQIVPGYYKGFMDVDDVTTYASSITAQISAECPSLSANGINPHLWISNPNVGLMCAAQYLFNPKASSELANYNVCHIQNIEVPVSTSGELSGSHGIYSIQAMNYPNFHAWALDSDRHYLYRISTTGQILCAIDINSIFKETELEYLIPDVLTPASFVLDSKKDIWITLYDSNYILKLSNSGKFLMLVNPLTSLGGLNKPYPADLPTSQQTLSLFDQESFFPSSSSFDDNNLFEPSYIDTDINDNVYVSYTNSLCAMIVKYSSSGSVLSVLSNLSNSIPQEIICDNAGNFWLNSKDKNSHGYYIERRDYNGTLYADNLGVDRRIGPFFNVNNVTLDRDQNLWLTHTTSLVAAGESCVSRIDSSTYEVRTIIMPNSFGDNFYLSENILEGICADYRNKIYVINSVENKVYVINGYTLEIENSFFINPISDVYSYLDNNGNTIKATNKYNKSAQAFGDWSGLRWANKYTSGLNSTLISLSGFSPKLDFFVNDAVSYDIFKQNEGYDLTAEMQKLAYIPSLRDSNFLFNEFFGSIFGTGEITTDDLAPQLLEKIANFVPNHCDVNECELDQLYSLAQMTDLISDDYVLNYPPSIKRLMSLASINLSHLWGARNFDNTDISNQFAANRGKLLSNVTYTVSAGQPVVLKVKDLPLFTLIHTGRVNNKSRYDLDELAEYLNLNKNSIWSETYEFYEYINSTSGDLLYSPVDWDSGLTSIHKQKSTVYLNSVELPISFNPSFVSVTDGNGAYPSQTVIDKVYDYLYISSNGIPYPAKAGSGINDGINEPLVNNFSIQKQKYNFKFKYRGGTETTNAHPILLNYPLGMTIHGIPIYSTSSPTKNLYTLNQNLSAPNLFYWNRHVLKNDYKLDFVNGGITPNGEYFYIDGLFLYNACNEYKFWSKNAYLSNSSFNGDHFRHPDGHSKIIGFCLDGYPIYGPYGYSDPSSSANWSRQTSSYQKYTTEPLGRYYTFSQVPAGYFSQDYLYVSGLGSLDRYNGRFCITPEYPAGTYAYFLTFEDDSLTIPAYPYIFGPETKERRDLSLISDNQLPFSVEDWEGDGGLLDTMFTYELYKGLNLLK